MSESDTIADVPPAASGQSNGMAIAALVLGLTGLTLSVMVGWIPIVGFFFTVPLTVLAIIFGFNGRSLAIRGASHRSSAVAGLICGFVGFGWTIFTQLMWWALAGYAWSVNKTPWSTWLSNCD